MKSRAYQYLAKHKNLLVMVVFILSFAYLFTYNTSDVEGNGDKNIWDFFPKLEKKEPIRLRRYKQSADLYKDRIIVRNGQKIIVWKYKVNLEGLIDFLDPADKIEHFFSTTKTSGLGTPTIKKIIDPDGNDLDNIAFSSTTDINTCKY